MLTLVDFFWKPLDTKSGGQVPDIFLMLYITFFPFFLCFLERLVKESWRMRGFGFADAKRKNV